MSPIYEFCFDFNITKYFFFLYYSHMLLNSKANSRKDKHIKTWNRFLHFL